MLQETKEKFKERHFCTECKTRSWDIIDDYMLTTEAWKSLHPEGRGFLCWDCLNIRAVRNNYPLTKDKFYKGGMGMPINSILFSNKPKRLRKIISRHRAFNMDNATLTLNSDLRIDSLIKESALYHNPDIKIVKTKQYFSDIAMSYNDALGKPIILGQNTFSTYLFSDLLETK